MPYEVKLYQRTKDLLAPAEYKSLSPLGTSPTITDDFGLSLSESNAIIDYILDKAEFEGCKNELRASPSSPNRNQYLIWFHVPPSSMQFVMSTDSLLRTIPKKLPWPLSWLFSLIGGKGALHCSR
jgi:glutathione S-transferase